MERQLPKNVRQIGNVSDSSKIYVEDYVDTFFNQLCEKADQEMIGAFLVGEKVQEEEQDYIYIYGAIQMQELGVKGKDFVIEDSVWKKACETCKEYFGNAEILGWFITGGEQSLEVNHNITKLHQKYFSREKSIFVTKTGREKEEKFYIYKYRNMMECGGHYVYYEKNIEMQNYMIATRKRIGFTPSEIIDDRAIKTFRSMIREKTEKTEQKNHSRLVYTLSTFLVLVILVIGVTMINNYDKMQHVQDSIDQLAGNDVDEENQTEEDETLPTQGEIVEQQGDETLSDKEDTENPDETDTSQGEGDTDDPVEDVPAPDSDGEENIEADSPVSSVVPEPESYVVKKGDTLETISRQIYGDISKIAEICELNGLEDGNLIFIGQKLLLP